MFGDIVPRGSELVDGAMLQGRHDLHEGAVVVELDTLHAKLDQELEDLGAIDRVTL